jgi:hypothetical protein
MRQYIIMRLIRDEYNGEDNSEKERENTEMYLWKHAPPSIRE